MSYKAVFDFFWGKKKKFGHSFDNIHSGCTSKKYLLHDKFETFNQKSFKLKII